MVQQWPQRRETTDLEQVTNIQHGIVKPAKTVDVIGIGATLESPLTTAYSPAVAERIVEHERNVEQASGTTGKTIEIET